ncbi:DUF5134 domain-containing protein [Nocardia uniformis]|uniref:DUF5134 domain-containing protein n=1 Tax=Nocardia uniformis TaxID=53432 RepID=A0A849C832_9NOCA|nr:DUF5134 domain-containing protein [Nocardia uniformis]NNH71039.1 DUF5134 domain-containing protein [Nocardia uniformis]
MAIFVQDHGALRWLAVIAFCVAATIVLGRLAAHRTIRVDQESDAAHLMMCLVMLAMLVFPAAVDPRAMRGVLTSMIVVYVLLLLGRIMQWRSEEATVPGDRVMAFAYHVVAAAAMLYAMSGHGGDHLHVGPAPGPTLVLAGLFTFDALAMALPTSRRALRHVFPHPIGTATSAAVLPHVVMDLGTAYMLIAAVA